MICANLRSWSKASSAMDDPRMTVLDYVPVGRTLRTVEGDVLKVEVEGPTEQMRTLVDNFVYPSWNARQAFTLRGDGPYVWRDVTLDYEGGDLAGFTGIADRVKA
jgi:hypothetical protein